MFLSINQLVNIFTGSESIRPVLHSEGNFELFISQLEEFRVALLLLQLNGEGNLAHLDGVGVLRLLYDLVEVRVKGFRNLSVLTFALIFQAELKALLGSSIVEVKHPRVLSQDVQNDLAALNVELHHGDDLVLHLYFLNFAVSQEDKVFGVAFSSFLQENIIEVVLITESLD